MYNRNSIKTRSNGFDNSTSIEVCRYKKYIDATNPNGDIVKLHWANMDFIIPLYQWRKWASRPIIELYQMGELGQYKKQLNK